MSYNLHFIISECGLEKDYNNNPYFKNAVDAIFAESFNIISVLHTIKTLSDFIVKQNKDLTKGVENASKT